MKDSKEIIELKSLSLKLKKDLKRFSAFEISTLENSKEILLSINIDWKRILYLLKKVKE